jgi:hypothetical protein
VIDEQHCLHCTEKVTKIFSHMRGAQRIYRDDDGREWSGSRCPDCYKEYKLLYDAKRRAKKGHLKIGTIAVCEQCSGQFEIVNGSHRICLLCRRE